MVISGSPVWVWSIMVLCKLSSFQRVITAEALIPPLKPSSLKCGGQSPKLCFEQCTWYGRKMCVVCINLTCAESVLHQPSWTIHIDKLPPVLRKTQISASYEWVLWTERVNVHKMTKRLHVQDEPEIMTHNINISIRCQMCHILSISIPVKIVNKTPSYATVEYPTYTNSSRGWQTITVW